MKMIRLLFLCCLCSLYGKAQDTLFFKNAGTLVVVVKEVSPTEIQYKKFDMPDGPMYIVSRNDLEKIVYKNGYTESLKPAVTAPSNTVAAQEFPVYESTPAPIAVNYDKIDYADTKRRQSALINLALSHPDPKRRNPLMSAAADLRRMKIHQDGTRTGAIIFGGIAIAGTVLYSAVYALSGSSGDLEVFAAPPIIFGTAGIILGAASISININLRKKRHEFVRLYNE